MMVFNKLPSRTLNLVTCQPQTSLTTELPCLVSTKWSLTIIFTTGNKYKERVLISRQILLLRWEEKKKVSFSGIQHRSYTF
jgi:hypothetical protein